MRGTLLFWDTMKAISASKAGCLSTRIPGANATQGASRGSRAKAARTAA